MTAPYNSLDTKAENAVRQVIVNAATTIPDAQILTSFEGNDTVVAPHSVIINCVGGIEDGHNSGNERLSITIKVKSSLDYSASTDQDPALVHQVFAGRVWDAIKSTTLAADMSAAVGDFYVFDSIQRRRGRTRVENRKAISEMLIEFTAAATDMT
jgi:predicted PilT family ATPase